MISKATPWKSTKKIEEEKEKEEKKRTRRVGEEGRDETRGEKWNGEEDEEEP